MERLVKCPVCGTENIQTYYREEVGLVENNYSCSNCGYYEEMSYSSPDMSLALSDLPAEDVVPVVRCRDCKWFGTSPLGGGWCNEVMARLMPYDGFCSYAERKDGDE